MNRLTDYPKTELFETFWYFVKIYHEGTVSLKTFYNTINCCAPKQWTANWFYMF